MRKMDFFLGSTQLKFIPFCFENQSAENTILPTTSRIDNPVETKTSANEGQHQLLSAFSPYSQDSEHSVTAYADAVVQRMEHTQAAVSTSVHQPVDESSDEIQGLGNPTEVASNLEIRGSSTPILPGGNEDADDNLPALKFALKVAIDTES